jgi:hypothetical protein
MGTQFLVSSTDALRYPHTSPTCLSRSYAPTNLALPPVLRSARSAGARGDRMEERRSSRTREPRARDIIAARTTTLKGVMGRMNRRRRADLSSATMAVALATATAMEVAPPSLENPAAASELLLARGGVAAPVEEGGARAADTGSSVRSAVERGPARCFHTSLTHSQDAIDGRIAATRTPIPSSLAAPARVEGEGEPLPPLAEKAEEAGHRRCYPRASPRRWGKTGDGEERGRGGSRLGIGG